MDGLKKHQYTLTTNFTTQQQNGKPVVSSRLSYHNYSFSLIKYKPASKIDISEEKVRFSTGGEFKNQREEQKLDKPKLNLLQLNDNIFLSSQEAFKSNEDHRNFELTSFEHAHMCWAMEEEKESDFDDFDSSLPQMIEEYKSEEKTVGQKIKMRS
jgi:hypothetical protein